MSGPRQATTGRGRAPDVANTIMTEGGVDGVTDRGTSQRGKTEDAAGASKTSQSSPWVAQLVTTTVTALLGGRCAGPHTTHGRCRSLNTRMCVREIRPGSSQVGCKRVRLQGISLAQNRDIKRAHTHKHGKPGIHLSVVSDCHVN